VGFLFNLWISLGGGGVFVNFFTIGHFLLVALFFVSFFIDFDETDSKRKSLPAYGFKIIKKKIREPKALRLLPMFVISKRKRYRRSMELNIFRKSIA
jgi:hypothetical protein